MNRFTAPLILLVALPFVAPTAAQTPIPAEPVAIGTTPIRDLGAFSAQEIALRWVAFKLN